MTLLPLITLVAGFAIALLSRRWRRTDLAAITILVAAAMEGVGRLLLHRVELITPRYWDLATCALALMLWTRRRRAGGIVGVPFLLAAGVTAFSLVRGIVTFSLEDALGQARTFGLFLVLAAVASLSAAPRRLVNAVSITGLLLGLYALGHAASQGLASAHELVFVDDAWFTLRAVPAAQALLVVQAAGLLVLAPPARLRLPLRYLAAGTCALAVLLLQHRSVWIAGFVGLVAVAMQARATHRARAIAVGCGVALFAAAMLAGPASAIGESLSESVQGITDTSSGTVGARLSGWQVLLEGELSNAPVTDKLVGTPWGYPFDRTVGGRFIQYSPHNHYLSLLLRVGVLGLGAWLVMLLYPARVAVGARRREHPQHSRSVIVWLLATQITFGVAYTIPPEQGLLLGIALALSHARRPRVGAAAVPVARSELA